jgi:hypothetical protein
MSTENFEQFWGQYLHDHAQRGTRALHFFGNAVGAAALVLGTIRLNPMIALIGLGLGYIAAWSGHILIERNWPSMRANPLWALQCEVRMLRFWLSGRLGQELACAGLDGGPK